MRGGMKNKTIKLAIDLLLVAGLCWLLYQFLR